MKKRKRSVTIGFLALKLFVILVIIGVLVLIGRNAYSFGYQIFAEETVSDPPGKKVAVTIEEGITDSELADLLEKTGLIKDSRVFWVQIQLSKYKDKIQPGSYILNTSWNSEKMLSVLSGEEETESETEE